MPREDSFKDDDEFRDNIVVKAFKKLSYKNISILLVIFPLEMLQHKTTVMTGEATIGNTFKAPI